ncbi:HK97 gp10 family phage protein [Pseudomonas nitritireducens]|uniref:HK97 gp10 family phage protein n=1 Tax=Pseudomonas nitroreducens TaxID=46680 RepID=A0A7W7P222_PSENT|nr:HK97-gp10 family putative phage morphogenesis protein [Pseudomonas nitritireducens]MBB4865463.1 HK97 gp10 family phage protein [Pseudomonas nitritireducens]
MPEAFEVDLKGLDEIMKKLRELGPKLERNFLRRAARKAMNIVKDEARARVSPTDDPNTAENIARNIVVQESGRRGKAVGGVVMRVGVLGGAKNVHAGGLVGRASLKENPGGDTWYWRFMEFGTEHQAARPFMRPAFEQNIEKVTETVAAELNKAIDKLAE